MTAVPNRDQASIDAAKIANYLLYDTHPVGRAKARFFQSFGFRQNGADELMRALLHLQDHAVAIAEVSSFGTKYRVDSPLASPDGRNPRVSTVWMVSHGETLPPFVTAFPC